MHVHTHVYTHAHTLFLAPMFQDGILPHISAARDKRRWDLCGLDLCTPMYCKQLGISKYQLTNMKKDILGGYLEPRADLRGTCTFHTAPQRKHADAWLHWAYWSLAEPLAETAQPASEDCEWDETQPISVNLDTSTLAGADLTFYAERHLPPGKLEELFELYSSCSAEHHASKTSFRRVYRQRWRKLLCFRHVGQHARCTTCSKISRMRVLAQTTAATEEARVLHDAHIEAIRLDRSTGNRIDRQGIESARPLSGPPEQTAMDDSVLSITADGMDQAKFRIPRNLALTKQFEKCWRPQAHLVGVCVSGVVDCFFCSMLIARATAA